MHLLQAVGAIFCSPTPHRMADEEEGQISHSHFLGSWSITFPSTGSALLCCPGEVQGLFTQVPHPSERSDEGQGQLCAALSSRPLLITGAKDINTDHCGRRATNPNLSLPAVQARTSPWSRWQAGHPPQPDPHRLHLFRSASPQDRN